MKFLKLTILLLTIAANTALAQEKIISRKQFFLDDTAIDLTLKTNLKKLSSSKKKPEYQSGTLTWIKADSTGDVTEEIKIRLRGNFRKEACFNASLMVDFRTGNEKSKMKNLKALKLVAPCEHNSEGVELVLKEYLIYKIYNLLTEKSYRVRLLQLTFSDISGSFKDYRSYAFAIEPTDDLAERNNCQEEEEKKVMTTQTNRSHTTLVNMFQYMIGNTDWAVPVYHNIKLLVPKDTLTALPYVVPYDFDYAGLVDAPYAVPAEVFGTSKVTERIYLGFPRSMEEIKETANLFLEKEKEIRNLIRQFEPLSRYHREQMDKYLDEFFEQIKSDRLLKKIFIDNARKR